MPLSRVRSRTIRFDLRTNPDFAITTRFSPFAGTLAHLRAS